MCYVLLTLDNHRKYVCIGTSFIFDKNIKLFFCLGHFGSLFKRTHLESGGASNVKLQYNRHVTKSVHINFKFDTGE